MTIKPSIISAIIFAQLLVSGVALSAFLPEWLGGIFNGSGPGRPKQLEFAAAPTLPPISSDTIKTDAGQLESPDHPDARGFLPTTASDIQPANPAEGITTIQAPRANQLGTAEADFPLHLPPGRQGLQPNLTIRYNSDGGNGWLGLGWNLDWQAIRLETRWGVPRFDANLETESYLLGAEPLSPVAHRDALQNRSAEKRFYPRVEKDFDRIIRHGNSPKNYWWEIVRKDGIRSFYGGLPASGVQNNAVLKDEAGNIAHWALTEVRDANDNFIRYQYALVEDPGVAGGTVKGYQLYPERITYTGNGTQEGVFSVQFIRDRQLNETRRTDVDIQARLGFKQVTADLLRRVEIRFQGAMVRSYELAYRQGAFYKTLLASIVEKDKDGNLFYRHDLEYFDEVRQGNDYRPFTAREDWTVPSDNLSGQLTIQDTAFQAKATLLGSSLSTASGINTTVTFGARRNLSSKTGTAGGHFGETNSEGEGLIALVDINGDKLADKVFQEGDKLYFRPNLFQGPDDDKAFGDKRPISGVNSLSASKTYTYFTGIEAHPPLFFVGKNAARSTTITDTYFSDFNGDGLMDLVAGGQVYFNHLNADGNPEFTLNSADTPSPVVTGASVDTTLLERDTAEANRLPEQFPLHDVVRMWEAPEPGLININAPVRLLQNTSPVAAQYAKKDGVRVAIQVRDTEVWLRTIAANDYNTYTPTGLTGIQVKKGERVYFRVQSRLNGAYDQVAWDPEITYAIPTPRERDANGKFVYRFKSSEDFLLASFQSVTMPLNGRIRIEGTFKKPITSDNVTATIYRAFNRDTIVVYNQVFRWDSVVNQPIVLDSVVRENQEYFFRVSSPTNVNWPAISWNPRIYYTAADNNAPVAGPDGQSWIEYYPAVDFTMFNETVFRAPYFVANRTGILLANPVFITSGTQESGTVTFSVKGVNKLYGEITFNITNGVVPRDIPFIRIQQVEANDTIFAEFHIANRRLANASIGRVNFNLIGNNPVLVNASIFTRPEPVLFGPLYRGWGQFTYRGNGIRANRPINETELTWPPFDTTLIPGIVAPEQIAGQFDPAKAGFIPMIAFPKTGSWNGFDDSTYVKAVGMSSSRMGKDDIQPDYLVGNGTQATAVYKIHRTETNATVGGASTTANAKSDTKTENLLDMLDGNGDGYPDAFGQKKVQYTNARGGLDTKVVRHDLGNQIAEGKATGFTPGGTFIQARTSNTNTGAGKALDDAASGPVKSLSVSLDMQAGETPQTAMSAIAIKGNFSDNADTIRHAWLDINGDKLVDKVYPDGKVALNLGYRFAAPETWAYTGIQTGSSEDFGSGSGLNIWNSSIRAGFSLSRTDNQVIQSLQDVNGDGLTDQITSSAPLKVRLNTGNGFGPEIVWGSNIGLAKSAAAGESFSKAITVCVPVLQFKLCLTPGNFNGNGGSREQQHLGDIDGNGATDFLVSGNDGELQVYRAVIGRTNLLKGIKRPLGATLALDYAQVGNTYDLPEPRWVLASVEQTDGLTGDGADRMKQLFEYANGRYDRHERAFLGFDTVKTYELDTERSDSTYLTTIAVYNNRNFYEKGLLKSQQQLDAEGKILLATEYTHALKDVLTGADLPPAFVTNAGGSAFPALTEMKKLFYEGQASAGLQTRVAYEYDKLGNIIRTTDYGDGTPDDLLKTEIAFHDNDAKYLKSIPATIQVSDSKGLLRKWELAIDARGNITQVKQAAGSGSTADRDIEYDNYGNVRKITRPPNHKNERLTYEYGYDNVVQAYVTEILDGYGYQSKQSWDYPSGRLLESTDINGQRIVYTLDAKGRVATVTGPYELAAGKSFTIAYEYHPEATVPYSKTRQYDPEHDSTFQTIAFIDGLGRTVQVKRSGSLFSGNGSEDQQVMIVSGRVIFDAFGQIVKTYYPTTEPFGNNETFNPAFDGISPTTRTYDALGRVIKTVLPDGRTNSALYEIGEDKNGITAFKTTLTDPLGNKQEHFTDTRGRLRAKQVFGPDGGIWTSYQYNVLSELLATIDDDGNETTFAYDQLGRVAQETRPDNGTTDFSYDLAGNLIKKVTPNIRAKIPNGGAILYTYEKERLVQIDYPQNFQNKVQLHYGPPGAQHNRAGRIWLQEDASGGQEFFFGPLGEVVKQIRTLLITESNVRTYVSEFAYDTWGRIQTLSYPDGEIVDYQYNRAGGLKGMSGAKSGRNYTYVAQLGYDKFGNRVFLKYGNGMSSQYTYDQASLRLTDLDLASRSGRVVQDMTYAYDAVDNRLSAKNAAAVEHLKLGGPSSYTFTYDNLYRLIKAEGEWAGFNRKESYTLDLRYDNLNNLTNKTQVHLRDTLELLETTYSLDYAYGQAQPHAPARVGPRAMTYDPNGNPTGWRTDNHFAFRQIIWDEDDRMMGLSDNGYISQFTYDAQGNRVIRSHGGTQGIFLNGAPAGAINHRNNYTAYVSPFLVAKEDQFTKHYYIGEERILSKVGTGKFNNKYWFGRGITAGSLNYTARIQRLQQAAQAYYQQLGIPPGHPTLPNYYGQPGYTGNPIPPADSLNPYNTPPRNWPKPLGPPTPGGPPGHPVWFGPEITNDNVKAGYGFEDPAAFQENNLFYYHAEPAGLSLHITDVNGQTRQHLEFTPFGETFINEYSTQDLQPYLFRGGEWDKEPGLYYFRTGFYDPRSSVWQSGRNGSLEWWRKFRGR